MASWTSLAGAEDGTSVPGEPEKRCLGSSAKRDKGEREKVGRPVGLYAVAGGGGEEELTRVARGF